MSTARTVPVTTEMDGDELDAEDAWHVVRRTGVRRLFVDSFVRFRYGDGFTNSRALALQGALAVVPFMLALTGLAADIDEERPRRVLARTIDSLSPGSGTRDALASAVTGPQSSEGAGEIALAIGLFFALLSMTTAMGQVERGSNRIYGIERDRPVLWKYGRAAILTAVLAVPVGTGFLLLVAGGSFADAMAEDYGWSDGTVRGWNIARWPLGVALLVFTIAALLNHAPRRRQPGLSWLALGAGVAVVLTLLSTGLLAAYVSASPSFGKIYGPLAGVFALLLWSLVSSIALFFGSAVCAQLEAVRSGQPAPAYDDPGRPTGARRRLPDLAAHLFAVGTARRILVGMCRNIRTLHNFEPPATRDEVHAAAVQYVRKVSGSTRPSQANQAAFDQAVAEIDAATRRLLDGLTTTAPPKDREVEAAKARARAEVRYARG